MAESETVERKIWYVDFPTFQYEEDVRALAKENNLKILNSMYDAGDGESDVPTLTKKNSNAPSEPVETHDESDQAEAKEEAVQDNHTLMVEHFRASGITKKPKVGDVESELGIDTNAKAIAAALEEAQTPVEETEEPAAE